MTSVQVNIDKEMMSMVKCFRVIDLQELLGYAGRNKNGRKSDLVNRAMEMITTTGSNRKIQLKIHELYQRRYPLQSSVKPSSFLHNPGTFPNSWQPYQNDQTVPAASNNFHSQVDVTWKPLPFFENLSDILHSTRLYSKSSHGVQESTSTFSIDQNQESKICRQEVDGALRKPIQVQLRFCEMGLSSEQSDRLPPDLRVRINSCFVPLPPLIPPTKQGELPKQQHRPLDITEICMNIGLNKVFTLSVKWTNPNRKNYVTCINLVRQLSVEDLLESLEERGPLLPHVSQNVIKQKLSRDSESDILTTSLKVSLLCPLGKMRMTYPTRPTDCRHLQCFDAMLFLRMNEKKPTWICPVCDKPADFRSLRIDGLFLEILKNTQSDEIEFTEDGTWHCAKRKMDFDTNANKPIDLSNSSQKTSDVDKISKNVDVIDLTGDSTDEEEPSKPLPNSPVRASSNTPVSTPSSPLNLGFNKQKNDGLDLPVSSSSYSPFRKSPQKLTPKSYLSPASSPYCKSESPLFKTRQNQSQYYPSKPFDLSSRHTPHKPTSVSPRFSPFSLNGSKESTPSLQIPSPHVSVSATPPLNGLLPFSEFSGLDRYSPASLNFDPNFLLRYPHPASFGDLLNARFLNSMSAPGPLNPYLLNQFPFMNSYDVSNLAQSSSVNNSSSRSNDYRLNTPQLDLTEDVNYNAESVD